MSTYWTGPLDIGRSLSSRHEDTSPSRPWPFDHDSPGELPGQTRNHLPGRCWCHGLHTDLEARQLNRPRQDLSSRPDQITYKTKGQQKADQRHDLTGYILTRDAKADQPPTMRDLIGHEYFDREPEPPPTPDLMLIGDLARGMRRKVRTIRKWINEEHVLPPAPYRVRNQQRAWSWAEGNDLIATAQAEGLLDNHKLPWQHTNFAQKAHDIARQHRG